jgi:hypothetical protein
LQAGLSRFFLRKIVVNSQIVSNDGSKQHQSFVFKGSVAAYDNDNANGASKEKQAVENFKSIRILM